MDDLRKANPDDFDRIAALEHACFKNSEGRFSRRQLRRLLHNPRAFCLIGANGLAMACWLKAGNGRKRWARLYSLAVHPDLRGRRWAEKLILAGFNWMARNRLDTCRAEVREDNYAARRLYTRLGFREIGLIPDYYASGQHGVRLIKKLDPHAKHL